MIVDFAVEGNDAIAALALNRLAARRKVDDFQSDRAQGDTLRFETAALIGAAVLKSL